MLLTRRRLMKHGAAGAALITAGGLPFRAFAAGDELTIAYNVNLPSFDPTVGPSAVNPTIQGIYQSVFDQYIGQAPDLKLQPGLLTEWGWNEDRTKVVMKVREGATWHDGSPVTPEDVVWSLERAGDEKTGNPIQFVWSKIGNFSVDGNTVTADVKSFEPTLFKWMALPHRLRAAEGLLREGRRRRLRAKPVGSGPYKVGGVRAERLSEARGPSTTTGAARRPSSRSIIKFVPDATSRVAEIESGRAEVVFDIPYEEYDRLKAKPGLKGVTRPISDIAMIFINDVGADDRQERAARGDLRDRQAAPDRPAARRLRRQDRHAAGAAIRRLRSLHQGRLRSGEGGRSF